jgi:hypothetical protein
VRLSHVARTRRTACRAQRPQRPRRDAAKRARADTALEGARRLPRGPGHAPGLDGLRFLVSHAESK